MEIGLDQRALCFLASDQHGLIPRHEVSTVQLTPANIQKSKKQNANECMTLTSPLSIQYTNSGQDESDTKNNQGERLPLAEIQLHQALN